MNTEEIFQDPEEEEYTRRLRELLKRRKIIHDDIKEVLNPLIDIKLRKNPGWSITKCLRIITQENSDLGFIRYQSLYQHLDDKHHAMIIQRKEIEQSNNSTALDCSITNFDEDAERVRNNYGISKDEKPEHFGSTEACINRDSHKDEIIAGLRAQVKRKQDNDIVVDWLQFQQWIRDEFFGEPPDRFVIMSEKGFAVGVRAA